MRNCEISRKTAETDIRLSLGPAKVGSLNCGMVGIESGVRFSSVSDAYSALSKGELDASAIQFVMDVITA